MIGRLRTIAALAALALAAAAAGLALPALDRDEARFAQASVQMIESGDFIRINFQDDARNKKPAGIYWLQAAAVQAFSSPEARAIWAYRLPSLLGLVVAVLATYGAGCVIVGRRAAFAGAGLLAVTVLAGAEAGIAKTDAMLMGVTTVAMAALAALYDGRHRAFGVLFWFALAAGVLVKGPVTPMVAGLAILALVLIDRRVRWLGPLLWWPGPLVAVAMIAPWLYFVQKATGGAFLTEALAQDLGPKLVSGHESHGAPPMLHTALTALLFWPGTLFLLPGLVLAYRAFLHPYPRLEIVAHALYLGGVALYLVIWSVNSLYPAQVTLPAMPALAALALFPVFMIALKSVFRPTEDGPLLAMRFLVAWAAPAWAVFELLPTKLAHYPLPLYPALALMAGAAYMSLVDRAIPVVPKILSATVFALVGGLFTIALLFIPELVNTGLILDPQFDRIVEMLERTPPAWMLAPLVVAGALFVLPLTLWRAPKAVLWLALAAGVTFHWGARFAVAPSLEPLWVSARLSETLEALSLHPRTSPLARPPLVSAGYNEPSLIFLTDTGTVLTDGAGAAAYAAQEAGRATLVEAREREAFERELGAAGASAVIVAEVNGLNYSRGEPVSIAIYRTTQRARRRPPASLDEAAQ